MFDFRPAQKITKNVPWVKTVKSDFFARFFINSGGKVYLVLQDQRYLNTEIHIQLEDVKILKEFLNEHI